MAIGERFFYPKLQSTYLELSSSIFSTQRDLIVFDIGANKGQSIRFFIGIFPRVKIYAFEPSKNTFDILKKYVSKVDGREVHVFQIGLGEVSETRNFYESILSETSTFVLPNENSLYLKKKNRILFQKSENAFTIVSANLSTFDAFIKDCGIDFVDVVKIDVEGFEYEVLQGASNALKAKKIGVIQFERHTNDMRNDNFEVIDQFLRNNWYLKVSEIKHPFGNFLRSYIEVNRLIMNFDLRIGNPDIHNGNN
jgi:FkbM family methyltransferase